MPRSWLSAAVFGALLAGLGSCPAPYRPFCRVGEPRLLSMASYGQLAARPGGEVVQLSTLQQLLPGGRFGPRQAHVERFDRSGTRLAEYSVELPASPGSFDLAPFVDTPDGIGALTTRRLSTARVDGGSDVFEQRSLELRSQDGGVLSIETADGGCRTACRICDCTALSFATLYRVGDSVVMDELATGTFSYGHRLRAFTVTGEALPTVLQLPSGQLVAGADALAVYPGPRLFSDRLDALCVPPEPPISGPLGLAWSLEQKVLISARLDDRSLLVQGFDFSGVSQLGPSRVSDAFDVVGVARSAHGAGVLFDAFSFDPDGGSGSQLWFAFVDEHGGKRGPDVAVGTGARGGLVTASPLDDHFAIFSQGSKGLELTEVVCE